MQVQYDLSADLKFTNDGDLDFSESENENTKTTLESSKGSFFTDPLNGWSGEEKVNSIIKKSEFIQGLKEEFKKDNVKADVSFSSTGEIGLISERIK